MTSICDERGEELLYAGVPISRVLEEDMGVGGVLSLLWFQKRLPDYANKFIEICLMLTADHGPAVSGAHNTIVCARAGKDLISSLVSGLLTIVRILKIDRCKTSTRDFLYCYEKSLKKPLSFTSEI